MVHVRGARAGASGIIPPSRAGMLWLCAGGSFYYISRLPPFFFFFFPLPILKSFFSFFSALFHSVCSSPFTSSIKKQPSAHGRMHR